MIKRYTAKDIFKLRPCDEYSRDLIKELGGKCKALSVRQIANLKIPSEDIIWCLLKLLPECTQHEAACQFAESVLYIFEDQHPDDTRPRDAIAAKRAWLKGEVDAKQLVVARAAAWDAGTDAWSARTGWADKDARAARDAARAVARDGWDAIEAAGVEEEKKQVKILLKLHKGCA